MSSPWMIGLLSTAYDLHDCRQSVIADLYETGFAVSAFEAPDFPVEPDRHSHDSCLSALERVDIVVLIIDKRYGGTYYGSANESITEKEYFEAIEKGIPCLCFVRRDAWNERHAYTINSNYSCSYVEDIKTIELINHVHKVFEDRKVSNWITFFDTIEDLKEKIHGKLSGLSRYLVEQVVKKQREILKNRRTSTGFSMPLDDVFRKGYYLQPQFTVDSGAFPQDCQELDEAVMRALQEEKSLLIYGEAGYGKTTVLAKSFFLHVDKFSGCGSYHIPFYIWLKDKDSQYHFDFEKYLQECFEEYKQKENYPCLRMEGIIPYFYLDGFDELSEKIAYEDIERISHSSIFRYPVLLTSRTQYAYRYLKNYDLANKFGIRVKIDEWDEKKALEYIDNFCKAKRVDQAFKDRVYGLLAENKDLKDMLDNPLLITMLLWIIEERKMDIPETVSTRVELFQQCFEALAERECGKGKLAGKTYQDLILIWSYFAWLIYKRKLPGGEPSKLKKLLTEIQTEYLPQYGSDYDEGILNAVFDISGEKVSGTFHEQFLEFLVANALRHACLNRQKPYPEFLKYVLRPEINSYFRGICEEGDEREKNTIAENIFELYKNKRDCTDGESIRVRVHAVYYVARLKSEKRTDDIQMAFAVEKNVSVRISLYFGAIKMGQLDKEQEFYDLLINDQEYNDANRGYHLAYYSDIPSEGDLPFSDPGDVDWSNTLKAFRKHFSSNQLGHYYLWRIDLVTMQQLIRIRKDIGPLTQDVLNEFEKLIHEKRGVEEYHKKIIDAYNSLKEQFELFSTKRTRESSKYNG